MPKSVRFTVVLPVDLVEALDAYCEDQENRATALLGTRVRVGRSSGIETILRRIFYPPADPPEGN